MRAKTLNPVATLMKILHVISSSGMYGAEAVILNLLRGMRDGGRHEGALAVFSHPQQPVVQLGERAAAEGFEVHAIPCRGTMDRSVAPVLRKVRKQTGADLIHAHGYKADVYAYMAMRRAKIPLISTCHTWHDNDFALRCYGVLDRWTLRRYAHVAAVSEDVGRRLLRAGVRADRVRLIRNGIDRQRFAGQLRTPSLEAAERPLRVGLVGRLAREKGIDIFLRAAASVLTSLPLTQFEVAGDGPDRAGLELLIEELGIRANARLVGRQEDMPAFLASLDLMVSASRLEGLPIALLEGMASRLPIVATDVGAVSGVVRDAVTGRLVRPEDHAVLAEAMLELLRDAALRERYGAAGSRLVQAEFSHERMTADYVQLYEEALSGKA